MTRSITVTVCALLGVLHAAVRADDPPEKLTFVQRLQLSTELRGRVATGVRALQSGKFSEATQAWQEAVNIARRLYPKTDYPNGHGNLATCINNLGFAYQAQGRLAEAEPHFKEALEITRQLYKGDHPEVERGLNNLGLLYAKQAKYTEAESLYKEALEMSRRMFKGDHTNVFRGLNNLGNLYREEGKYVAAERLLTEALEMVKRLNHRDHPNVETALSSLGALYRDMGRLAEAEALYKEAQAMTRRLFKGDHPNVARALNNLAYLYQDQGNYAEAELMFRESLEMLNRIYKGDHPRVARTLNNLGLVNQYQGKLAEAEPLHVEALEMTRRLYQGDHPDTVSSLQDLGQLYRARENDAKAEPLFTEALEMARRLHKGDHGGVVLSLNYLANLYRSQGRYAEAQRLYQDALDMTKRLYKGDHANVAGCMLNLAGLCNAQGDHAEAERLFKDALEMLRRTQRSNHPLMISGLYNRAGMCRDQGRLTEAEQLCAEALDSFNQRLTEYVKQKSEGEALTVASSQKSPRDRYLAITRLRAGEPGQTYDPVATYGRLWTAKGIISRVLEQRQLQARAVRDPAIANKLSAYTEARRQRANLLLARATTDPATLKQRDADLQEQEATIAKLRAELARELPTLSRTARLNNATLADLREMLPADAAILDYFLYTVIDWDDTQPPGNEATKSTRYAAFVVTKDNVAWVDLGTAGRIDAAISTWREDITSGKPIPATVPATVRELIWNEVAKKLPAKIRTVYVCPDGSLCKLPFAALPGNRPGTILLEDFAIATIPHAPFLLDKLWRQTPTESPPKSAFVVGGVNYDAEVTVPEERVAAASPLVKPDEELKWSFLPSTVGEAHGVATAAAQHQLTATSLSGDEATTGEVLRRLPEAGVAHFATHGFFADEHFRGLFQLDEKDFEMSLKGERIGRAVNSPLVMTGLVFAGANNPQAPGRGIVTGELLVDLDLSGLELAVLSACETGLGDVAGGEGVYGLQRAFHYAGTRNVVASLWKVPDQSTAALMHLFYQNLWEKDLPPIDALRKAQLFLYRHPKEISALAKGFRGTFEEVPGTATEVQPAVDGTAHPMLWAAFTLSGPGN